MIGDGRPMRIVLPAISDVYLTTTCGARSRNACTIALNLVHSPLGERPNAMTDCPTVRSEWSTPSTMVGRGATGPEAAAACDGGCERRGRLRGRDEERGAGLAGSTYGPNGWTFFYQKQKLGAPIGS